MSERIRISDCPIVPAIARQRVRRRNGKIHHKALRAQVTPELLTEQLLDVGLIIHHKN